MGNTLKVLPWLYRFKTKSHDKIPIYRRNTRNIQQVEIETGYFINGSEWNARSYKIRSTELQARKINEHPATTKFKITNNYTQPLKDQKRFLLSGIKKSFKRKGLLFFCRRGCVGICKY